MGAVASMIAVVESGLSKLRSVGVVGAVDGKDTVARVVSVDGNHSLPIDPRPVASDSLLAVV